MGGNLSYEFPPFRLDAGERALFQNGAPLSIPPKELETLLLLVENAGRIVERQQLLERVWPETFVEEGNLSRHVSYLRKRLSDVSGRDDLIETIPKRGYRFRALVSVVEPGAMRERIPMAMAPPGPASRTPKRIYALVTAVVAVALTVGGYYAFVHDRTEHAPRFRQLTFQRGNVFAARFAADGENIIYSASWNGASKAELFETRTQARAAHPLQLEDVEFMAVARNGDLAVRLRSNHPGTPLGTLALVPAAGGAPREILEDVWHFDWVPGGDSLAIVRLIDQEWRLEFPIGKVVLASKTGAMSGIRFSPDGNMIAYLEHPSAADSRGFVAVTDLTGRKRRLTPEWSDLNGLAWSPDGSEIWFTGTESGSNTTLHAVSLDGKLRRLIHLPGRLRLHDISPAGKVLLSTDRNHQGVFASRTPVTEAVNLSWLDWTLGAALSRDGQWAVLEESGEGGGGDYTVFLRKMDGSPAMQLGTGWAADISPDNKWVISGNTKQPAPTVLLPTGPGQPITLNDGALEHGRVMSFLPDGTGILAIAARPQENLRTFLIPLDGSAPRPVGPESFRVATASPDSKQVAGWTGNRAAIVSLEDGAVVKELPALDQQDRIRQWSADGRSLFVFRPAQQTANIFEVDIQTGKRKLACSFTPVDSAGVTFHREARVDPAGKHFLFTVGHTLSDLFLVENVK